jgi:hypothetical protein
MKWYNAFVFAFGLAFAVALALFPKQAPAQDVVTARGLMCDTAEQVAVPSREWLELKVA